MTACQIRLQKDLENLDSLYGAKLIIPDPNNIQDFIIEITPVEGIWQGGVFDFHFTIPDDFPFQRPSIICQTRIWHPNIEETGAVCLNILRDNYTAAMSIDQLVLGLQFLFSEPNPNSPLNKEAAEQYSSNIAAFKEKAQEYMALYCKHK